MRSSSDNEASPIASATGSHSSRQEIEGCAPAACADVAVFCGCTRREFRAAGMNGREFVVVGMAVFWSARCKAFNRLGGCGR